MKLTLERMQEEVLNWVTRCFGASQANGPDVRGMRLAEESIEFCQAVNVDAEKLHKLIDYVYARPSGNPFQGMRCRVLIRGKMNSAMVELEDGERVITSRYAVRLLVSKPKRQKQERDAVVRRWLKEYAPVRVAELGIQKQLFSRRGVRMVQLTVERMGKPHAVVVPKRQYTRVARLLALQACCVWERLSVMTRCACVPCLPLQG